MSFVNNKIFEKGDEVISTRHFYTPDGDEIKRGEHLIITEVCNDEDEDRIIYELEDMEECVAGKCDATNLVKVDTPTKFIRLDESTIDDMIKDIRAKHKYLEIRQNELYDIEELIRLSESNDALKNQYLKKSLTANFSFEGKDYKIGDLQNLTTDFLKIISKDLEKEVTELQEYFNKIRDVLDI